MFDTHADHPTYRWMPAAGRFAPREISNARARLVALADHLDLDLGDDLTTEIDNYNRLADWTVGDHAITDTKSPARRAFAAATLDALERGDDPLEDPAVVRVVVGSFLVDTKVCAHALGEEHARRHRTAVTTSYPALHKRLTGTYRKIAAKLTAAAKNAPGLAYDDEAGWLRSGLGADWTTVHTQVPNALACIETAQVLAATLGHRHLDWRLVGFEPHLEDLTTDDPGAKIAAPTPANLWAAYLARWTPALADVDAYAHRIALLKDHRRTVTEKAQADADAARQAAIDAKREATGEAQADRAYRRHVDEYVERTKAEHARRAATSRTW